MWRSDCESRILKTYVPAGRLCWPTPGTSTGPLKVITVFRFQSSALAEDTLSTQSTVRQGMIPIRLSSFIVFLLLVFVKLVRAVVILGDLFMESGHEEI